MQTNPPTTVKALYMTRCCRSIANPIGIIYTQLAPVGLLGEHAVSLSHYRRFTTVKLLHHWALFPSSSKQHEQEILCSIYIFCMMTSGSNECSSSGNLVQLRLRSALETTLPRSCIVGWLFMTDRETYWLNCLWEQSQFWKPGQVRSVCSEVSRLYYSNPDNCQDFY